MRLIAPDRAPRGAALARDVRSGQPGAVPLLRAGTRMSPDYARRLAEMGVRAVWIDDAGSAGIEPLPPLDDHRRAWLERDVADVMTGAGAALAAGSALDPAALERIDAVAREITRRVADLPEAAYAFADLAVADAYTHRHAVSVTVLGLMLADRHWRRWGWVDWQGRRRDDRVEERLVKLGLGLLLHDVGKLAVPLEVLHKPGPLDAGEWELIRRHPEIGVAMLEPAGVTPLALDVVRSHHERLDGSGYPSALAGDHVHEFARIAAIADTYDAITSDRPYQAGRPPHVALNILAADAPVKYDPDLLATFLRVAAPFPVGTEVPLPGGAAAVVAGAAPGDPWEPHVRLPSGAETTVDLRHLDWSRPAALRR